jgi:hypothetical protein
VHLKRLQISVKERSIFWANGSQFEIQENILISGSQPFLARATLESEKNLAAHLCLQLPQI